MKKNPLLVELIGETEKFAKYMNDSESKEEHFMYCFLARNYFPALICGELGLNTEELLNAVLCREYAGVSYAEIENRTVSVFGSLVLVLSIDLVFLTIATSSSFQKFILSRGIVPHEFAMEAYGLCGWDFTTGRML